jgi:hypothetical protein
VIEPFNSKWQRRDGLRGRRNLFNEEVHLFPVHTLHRICAKRIPQRVGEVKQLAFPHPSSQLVLTSQLSLTLSRGGW